MCTKKIMDIWQVNTHQPHWGTVHIHLFILAARAKDPDNKFCSSSYIVFVMHLDIAYI